MKFRKQVRYHRKRSLIKAQVNYFSNFGPSITSLKIVHFFVIVCRRKRKNLKLQNRVNSLTLPCCFHFHIQPSRTIKLIAPTILEQFHRESKNKKSPAHKYDFVLSNRWRATAPAKMARVR